MKVAKLRNLLKGKTVFSTNQTAVDFGISGLLIIPPYFLFSNIILPICLLLSISLWALTASFNLKVL